MLAYSLHARCPLVYGEKVLCSEDHWLRFSLHDLVDALVAKRKETAESTWMTKEYQQCLLNYYDALVWMLTTGRPQGFLPGYQYSLGCKIDELHYSATLCTAYQKEPCCQERTCEHGTVLGITCEKHGNFDFSVKCLQGNCRPSDWKL